MKRIFQLLFLSFCLISQAQNLKIIQKPIDYSKERMNLSLDYMKEHHNLIQKTPNITPKIIVLHYTAGGTIESNFRYFNNLYLENHRATLKNQSPLNVSAHFLVDRDGTVYQLVDPELFTDPTGIKFGKSGADYSYDSTGCSTDGKCTGYTLLSTMEREGDYRKQNREHKN